MGYIIQYNFTVAEYLPVLTEAEYDEKSTKALQKQQSIEKIQNQNIRWILHRTIRWCLVYTVKIFLYLLALSDSRHICKFSLNLSGPLVSIDNGQKTILKGSVMLFSVLSVFFESVISIKKWINCWLIQHTSQLQIKRASWGLQSPKDGRCRAHIQAYFIRLWNIELVCGVVVPLGVCVVGAVCKSGCDTPVCSRRLISGTCWEILQGKWWNLKLRCSRQVASQILLATAEQCLCNFGAKLKWMQVLDELCIDVGQINWAWEAELWLICEFQKSGPKRQIQFSWILRESLHQGYITNRWGIFNILPFTK